MGSEKDIRFLVLLIFHVVLIAFYHWNMPQNADGWQLAKYDVFVFIVYACGFGLCRLDKREF